MSGHEFSWWELPGAAGENRTEAQYKARIAELKEPRPKKEPQPGLPYSQEAAASMLLALKMVQLHPEGLPPVTRALIDLAISKAEGRS